MKIRHIESKNSQLKINQSVGAFAYSWLYRGQELLFAPSQEMQAGYGKLFGIPLMYPFANRLSPAQLHTDALTGEHLEAAAHTWLKDGNGLVMHGLTWQQERWVFEEAKSSADRATFSLTWHAEIDLFQYLPIHHTIELCYQLLDHGLRVITTIRNMDQEPLPLSYGYHPYFSISRHEQSDCSIKIPAGGYYETNESLMPTGNILPVADLFEVACFHPIEQMELDTCFTHFNREPNGSVAIELNKPLHQLVVKMDDQFNNAIVYLPKDKNKQYICIEPMISTTNAWHSRFDQLPRVPAMGTHQSVFDILIVENQFM